MDANQFETQLNADGYNNVERREGTANFQAKPHTHPFAVRALVLAGEFTLNKEGVPQTYHAGEVLAMDANCLHFEAFGPEGSTYILGRKHPA